MKSTIAWALSLTVCTWALTFSAAVAFSVTSASTASAFLEATASSFSLTTSCLDSSFTDSDASTSFFKPEWEKNCAWNNWILKAYQLSYLTYNSTSSLFISDFFNFSRETEKLIIFARSDQYWRKWDRIIFSNIQMHWCCNFELTIKNSYYFKNYDNLVQFSLDLRNFEHFFASKTAVELLHFCMQTITKIFITQKIYLRYNILMRNVVFGKHSHQPIEIQLFITCILRDLVVLEF